MSPLSSKALSPLVAASTRAVASTRAAAIASAAAASLATWAALASMAWGQAAALKAAEGHFVALGVALVVAAASVLAPRVGWGLAVVAVGVVWTLPYGPARAVVLTAVLAAGLFLAARAARVTRRLDARHGVALAVGLQALLRPDLLLWPLLDARTLVSIAVLPVVVGVSCAVLATAVRGMDVPDDDRRPLLVLLAAALLAPGWNVTVTLSLVAVAAGAVLGAPRRHLRSAFRPLVRSALPLRLAAGAVLFGAAVATVAVGSPAFGSVVLGGGCAFAFLPRRADGRRLPGPAVVAVPAILLFAAHGAGLSAPLALALALVPGALVAAPADRWLVAAGFVLAFAGSGLRADPEGAAVGLALLALLTPAAASGRGIDLPLRWVLLLAAPVLLLAAYPFVHAAPLRDVVDLLGLGPVPFAVLGALLVCGLGPLTRGLPPHLPLARLGPATFLSIAAGLALLLALPPVGQRPLEVPSTLAAGGVQAHEHPGKVAVALDGRAVRTVSIDTSLVHAPQLETGRPVATVQLYAGAERLAEHRLLAGRDTADWAAARPDVAGLPGFAAPPPWLGHVAPAGTFFGQRYRAVFDAAEPSTPTRLVIRLDRDLPPQTRLIVHALEVR